MKILLFLLLLQTNPFVGSWRIIQVKQTLITKDVTSAENTVWPPNTIYTFDNTTLYATAEGVQILSEPYNIENNSIYFPKSNTVWLNVKISNDTLFCEYNQYSDNGQQILNNKAIMLRMNK